MVDSTDRTSIAKMYGYCAAAVRGWPGRPRVLGPPAQQSGIACHAGLGDVCTFPFGFLKIQAAPGDLAIADAHDRHPAFFQRRPILLGPAPDPFAPLLLSNDGEADELGPEVRATHGRSGGGLGGERHRRSRSGQKNQDPRSSRDDDLDLPRPRVSRLGATSAVPRCHSKYRFLPALRPMVGKPSTRKRLAATSSRCLALSVI
jgi:hypothetical protein